MSPPWRRSSGSSSKDLARSATTLKGTGPIGRSSRETGVRGLRYAVARGVSRWRRPDTSRCRTSREAFAAVPVPTAEAEAESPGTGWTYSYVAEPGAAETDELSAPIAPVLPAAPVADPLRVLPGATRTSRPAVGRAWRRPSAAEAPTAYAAGAGRRRRRAPSRPAPAAVRRRGRARLRRRPRCSSPSRRPRSRPTSVARPRPRATADDISLNDLLMHVLDTGASDLHLTSGARPALRLNGELKQMRGRSRSSPRPSSSGCCTPRSPRSSGRSSRRTSSSTSPTACPAGPGSG